MEPGNEKVSVPVPPEAVNAVDESARPNVVVMFDPPDITISPLTVTTICFEAVAPTESVTMTERVSTPTALLDATVTIPVTLSTVIPVVTGEIEYRFVPVPRVLVNAVEDFATFLVVVMSEPPAMATIWLTTIFNATVVETPSESVAVTDSLYVPVSMPTAIVTAPVFESMLMYWL